MTTAVTESDAGPTRGPRLVGLRAPADDAYLDRVRAVWAAGDAVLPLPNEPTAAARLTAVLRPDAVVGPAGAGHADAAGGDQPPPPLPGDAALVVATSGSSGAPRGVVLSEGAVAAAVSTGNERLGTRTDDRWLCCLPLHHVAGLLVLLRGRSCDAPTMVHDGFDATAVAAALDDPAPPTLVALVPTMLHRLLEAGVEIRRFRRILLGGAAADPALLSRAKRAGAAVVTSYGMTETCGGVVYDGVPLDGTAVALDPSGGILLAGPTMCSGFRDGAPAPRRWLVTADHGRWGADGRLEVLGRRDDVIVTGGENVHARAIEAALRGVPGVHDAAVVGVDDPEWGQRVEAWIVGEAALDRVAATVRRTLPPPAVPKRLHQVAELPRTALGKVARTQLRSLTATARWPAA